MRRFVLYLIAAFLAIFVNFGSLGFFEWAVKTFFPSISDIAIVSFKFWFIIALGTGTIVGFIFKFLIDKLLIFKTRTKMIETTQELFKYLGFAIITTFIFWGTEIAFLKILGQNYYLLGGLIGLAIGYTLKFILDRQYVFTNMPYEVKS